MIRHLLPRIDSGSWGGATLTDPEGRRETAHGRALGIQWLGILIEIGIGRVSKVKGR